MDGCGLRPPQFVRQALDVLPILRIKSVICANPPPIFLSMLLYHIKIHFSIEFWLFRHKNLFYQITLSHISDEIFNSRTRRLIYRVIYTCWTLTAKYIPMGLFLFNSKIFSFFTDNQYIVLLESINGNPIFWHIITRFFKKIKINFNKISYVYRNEYHATKANA